MTWLWAAALFLAGYLWGKFDLAVLALIFDKERSMRRLRTLPRRILGHRTQVATWAIVVAFLFSLFGSTIGVIVASEQAGQKRDDRARTNCGITFNRLSALARDDRVAAQIFALKRQIEGVEQDSRYQTRLAHALVQPGITVDDLLAIFADKKDADARVIRGLTHQLEVSNRHPYPPPNFCTPTARKSSGAGAQAAAR